MDSKAVHSPVFLVFPPEISTPECQPTKLTAIAYKPQNRVQKLCMTKMKILGAAQVLLGMVNFSFGVVFLFTLVKPLPRFPFVLVSGYPFWGSVLFITSGSLLIALNRNISKTLIRASCVTSFLSALGAAAGIVLLALGFVLDGSYLCGYTGDSGPCDSATVLLMGILAMLMVLSILELLIALPFSVMGCHAQSR